MSWVACIAKTRPNTSMRSRKKHGSWKPVKYMVKPWIQMWNQVKSTRDGGSVFLKLPIPGCIKILWHNLDIWHLIYVCKQHTFHLGGSISNFIDKRMLYGMVSVSIGKLPILTDTIPYNIRFSIKFDILPPKWKVCCLHTYIRCQMCKLCHSIFYTAWYR